MAKTLAENYADVQKLHVEATEKNATDAYPLIFNSYAQLLNMAPEEPALLFSMGSICKQMGWNGMAINMLKLSVQSRPTPEAWCNLGTAYRAEYMMEEAKEAWLKALELRPDCADYYVNLSTLYINEGNPAPGLEYSQKAIELEPNNAKAHWNRSLMLLESGRWEEGFNAYEAGLMTFDRAPRNFDKDGKTPEWEGQDLRDKVVVVYGEQGIGDEIMFASALPDLIDTGAKVIYECHPRLEGVMRRSFPELLAIYPTRKKNTIDWTEKHQIDYKVAIGSLFYHFRSNGVFPRKPYLIPDPEKVAEYREWLRLSGPGPYIGMGYAGGSKKTNTKARSLQLNPLRPILEQPATFISLQYTPEADDKFKRFKDDSGITVHHWPEVVRNYDYDETIALIAALDLVVIVNTSVVHVCGAIGKDCFTLTPDSCAWRYAQGANHMVMYGDWVTQIREGGSIEQAIGEAADAVFSFIHEYRLRVAS